MSSSIFVFHLPPTPQGCVDSAPQPPQLSNEKQNTDVRSASFKPLSTSSAIIYALELVYLPHLQS